MVSSVHVVVVVAPCWPQAHLRTSWWPAVQGPRVWSEIVLTEWGWVRKHPRRQETDTKYNQYWCGARYTRYTCNLKTWFTPTFCHNQTRQAPTSYPTQPQPLLINFLFVLGKKRGAILQPRWLPVWRITSSWWDSLWRWQRSIPRYGLTVLSNINKRPSQYYSLTSNVTGIFNWISTR